MLDTLRQYPVIGIGTSIGGSALPFIEWLSPYLQFVGLVLGVTIGLITVVLKIKELLK